MRESAGARVVRALCAWYGRAMRARAKVRWRATASQPHLSVSALATRGSQGANVRGLGGGRSERGSEERADRTESTQASHREPSTRERGKKRPREPTERVPRARQRAAPSPHRGHPTPPPREKRLYKAPHWDFYGAVGRNPTAVLPYGRGHRWARSRMFTDVKPAGMMGLHRYRCRA